MGETSVNNLSPELLAQLYSQESNDPFLMLVTLTHSTLPTPIRFVNNTVDIVSRGHTFISFPMTINLPVDDGETAKEFAMTFDNVSREIIDELRTITTPMSVEIEMILASNHNYVQIVFDELLLKSITYNKQSITAKIMVDTFLTVSMTSEKYTPQNFPGIF